MTLLIVLKIFLCLGLVFLGFIITTFVLSMTAISNKSEFVEVKELNITENNKLIINIEKAQSR